MRCWAPIRAPRLSRRFCGSRRSERFRDERPRPSGPRNKGGNTMKRREILLGGAVLALAPSSARAQAAKALKIGVMNDMSGVYADFQGPGSVIAAKLAVEDYSAPLGVSVEIVSADHQNKSDVGAAIARKWFDSDGVGVIMDLPNSAGA